MPETSPTKDLRYGATVVGLTPTPLAPPQQTAYRGLFIYASPDNQSRVWLGGQHVRTSGAAEGFMMPAGFGLAIPADNVDGLFLISDDIGNKVYWASL